MEQTSVIACKICGQAHRLEPLRPGTVAECVRCGSRLAKRSRSSLHRTAALSLAALILYIPANVLPILRLELYGASSENTVWDGVVKFYQGHNYIIALIVLLASILIPLLKLFGLFFVVITTARKSGRGKQARTWLFRLIESIGRWAMLDVFVVSIWVAVVKMGQLANVTPGRGLLPFGCVVVLTLLASASFDPQLIWEKHDEPGK
ncbi:MAG TPA: paraquat-inducible protein A [Tepidisphaeraceae bacterium]|nr:paraquat-inducible protein A [Tepidisphaeraceae bacterium]